MKMLRSLLLLVRWDGAVAKERHKEGHRKEDEPPPREIRAVLGETLDSTVILRGRTWLIHRYDPANRVGIIVPFLLEVVVIGENNNIYGRQINEGDDAANLASTVEEGCNQRRGCKANRLL